MASVRDDSMTAQIASSDRPGILVVDDDEGIRENIVDLLGSEDYRVVSAADATEALRVLESEKIDLLLTDFQMPGPSGVELIEAARKKDAALPVILMTAYLYVYDQLDDDKKRDITILRKPFDADEVLKVVANELRRGDAPEN
ncbi:MAG: response regulator [Methanobacteriota archaeon]|jgi:two-component system, response regulator FlrC|nr:MAG: response regulator [Euryarchaeota archaeon]